MTRRDEVDPDELSYYDRERKMEEAGVSDTDRAVSELTSAERDDLVSETRDQYEMIYAQFPVDDSLWRDLAENILDSHVGVSVVDHIGRDLLVGWLAEAARL